MHPNHHLNYLFHFSGCLLLVIGRLGQSCHQRTSKALWFCGQWGLGSPLTLLPLSTIVLPSSCAGAVPWVSFLSRLIGGVQLQSSGTRHSDAVLFSSESHRLTPSEFFFSLLVMRTACSYFTLCSTPICIILISPVRLCLNTPFLFTDDCADCLLRWSRDLFLSPPAGLPLCLESIITKCVTLIFFLNFVLFLSFCGCLKMVLLLNTCASWHKAKLRNLRQDNLVCPLPKQSSAASLRHFQLLHLLSFCLFHIQTIIDIFLSSSVS